MFFKFFCPTHTFFFNIQKIFLLNHKPTGSTIVDAPLGQVEAFDCYNQKLQDEAVRRAVIENDRYIQETEDMHDKMVDALAVIAAITDPEAKAEAYRKMFNDCCLDDIKLILGSMCNHPTPPTV